MAASYIEEAIGVWGNKISMLRLISGDLLILHGAEVQVVQTMELLKVEGKEPVKDQRCREQ